MQFKKLGMSLLLFGLVGCGTTPVTQNNALSNAPSSAPSSDGKPSVVVSYSVLCDLTQQIAQDTINLKCLLPAGQDPHTYQPTPDDRQSIDKRK